MLRAHRTERGWSQERLARELRRLAQQQGLRLPDVGVLKPQISRWENGRKDPSDIYRPLLRRLFGASDRALGFREPRDEGAASESLLVVRGAASATLAAALSRARRVDDDVLAELQTMVDSYRRLDRRFGAGVTSVGLRSLLAQATDLANHSVHPNQQRHIARIAADAATLLGWLALDSDRPQEAWEYFRQGAQSAAEAGDAALRSFALAESAYVQVHLGRHRDAIALLDRADSEGGQSLPPRLRTWLHAARAEISAAAGDLQNARRALDHAHDVPGSEEQEQPIPYVGYLDEAHLTRWAGSILATAGQPDAVETLTRALAVADPTFVRARAGLLVDLAVAHVFAGDLDAACAAAAEAAQLATETGSIRHRRRLQRLRSALRPVAHTDAYSWLIDQLGPDG